VTRVGILAAVVIIVVASIFFGFRKAAREHAKKPSPLEQERPFRKIDPESRKLLVEHIAEARAKRTGDGALPAAYLVTQRAALEAALVKCGKLSAEITIRGEPDVGALVETTDPRACVRETIDGVELAAPLTGGTATLTLAVTP
jgi:hypothetical protein